MHHREPVAPGQGEPWPVVAVIAEYLVVLLAYDHVVLHARSLPLVHHDRQDSPHLVQGAEG